MCCPRCCCTFAWSYQVELQWTNRHYYYRESLLGSLGEVRLLLGVCIFLYNLWSVYQSPQPSCLQKMLNLVIPHRPVWRIQLIYGPPVNFSHRSVRCCKSKLTQAKIIQVVMESPSSLKLVEELYLPPSLKHSLLQSQNDAVKHPGPITCFVNLTEQLSCEI